MQVIELIEGPFDGLLIEEPDQDSVKEEYVLEHFGKQHRYCLSPNPPLPSFDFTKWPYLHFGIIKPRKPRKSRAKSRDH